MRIGIAGDWHGNRPWALRCVQAMADTGVGEIFHLGDFGIWPGPSGRSYLLDLEAALASRAMAMFVTPGNHEDYDQISQVSALDLGHDIGAVQWVSDHIALLPRGHRWQRDGWTFVSLGGAASVDRAMRRAGLDWWEAEMITDEDVEHVVEAGPADVMLTHDAPESSYGTRKVADVMRDNPGRWPASALQYAAVGHHRLTTAVLGVQPRLLLHGHFHLRDEAWVERFGHPTHVVAVDCDGAVDGNLVVVTLPDRSSDQEPVVEWLNLPNLS